MSLSTTSAFKQQEAEVIGSPAKTTGPNGARPRQAPKPFFNPWRFGFIGVLILAVCAYLPSLHGLKVWDDNALLDGSGIGGGQSILSALTKPFLGAYFRPLVSLSFYFDNKLWDGTPFYYHQTNILIHLLACAALVGFVLAAFNRKSLALLSGILFAVQPAQVGAVAWIGGRTDSLCALLVILFAYTLLLGVRATGGKRYAWIGTSVLFFFLAAVTKEQVIAMILLVPFAAKAFAREDERPDFKAYVRYTTPYAIASLVFAVLWFSFNPNPFSPEGRGFVGQLLTAGQTTIYYTLLFVAPSSKWMHTLSLGSLEAAGTSIAVAGLILLGALLTGAAFCIKKNPKLGWFVAFIALGLLPVSNLVPLPSLLVAPYRAGVAGAGVAVLFAWILLSVRFRPAAMVVGGAFVLWCTWLTYWGSSQWMNPISIFSRITEADPYSIIARRNMSSYLLITGQAKPAADQMKQILTMLYGSSDWQDTQKALFRFKTDPELRRRVVENQGNEVVPESWLGELFAQLGFAQAQLKDFKTSQVTFKTAMAIDPKNPRANIGLAEYAMSSGDYDSAARYLRVAIAVHPSDPALYALLGQVYLDQNRLALADETYTQSIAIEPWFGPTYQQLAEVQVKEGHIADAINTLKSALNCQVRDEPDINARLAQLQKGSGKA